MENSDDQILTWLEGYIEGMTDQDSVNKGQVINLIEKLELKLKPESPPQTETEQTEPKDDLPF